MGRLNDQCSRSLGCIYSGQISVWNLLDVILDLQTWKFLWYRALLLEKEFEHEKPENPEPP